MSPEPDLHRRDFATGAAAFMHGAFAALALPAWVVGLTMIGVGSIARDVGFPLGAAVLSTILIWAAPAQLILFAGVGGGATSLALAVSVGMSSMRFLPMTIALIPLLRRPGQSTGLQLAFAHFVAVTVWTESLRRLPEIAPERRAPYYLGSAFACILVCAICTALGFVLAGTTPAPIAAGLLFLSPLFFTLSLMAGARRLADFTAIGLGFALAPLFERIAPGGLDLALTGVVAGGVAFALGRLRKNDGGGAA